MGKEAVGAGMEGGSGVGAGGKRLGVRGWWQ